MKLEKDELENLYTVERKSAQQIANLKGVSLHSVNYWLKKHSINMRGMSDAIYCWHNPDGDPFTFTPAVTKDDRELWGLGLALYWGEGNKANKNIVKIGNSDPGVINIFMKFLARFFQVEKYHLKFHLHLFSDIDLNKAQSFWENALGITSGQFYKPTVTITGKLGTYRKRSEYGVITLYYANTKVRNILVGEIATLAQW